MSNDALVYELENKVKALKDGLKEANDSIKFWGNRIEGQEKWSSSVNERLKTLEQGQTRTQEMLQDILDRLPPAESKA